MNRCVSSTPVFMFRRSSSYSPLKAPCAPRTITVTFPPGTAFNAAPMDFQGRPQEPSLAAPV